MQCCSHCGVVKQVYFVETVLVGLDRSEMPFQTLRGLGFPFSLE